MNISDYSFHDASILEVKEITENQILEFLIDFPVNWANNKFEQKILRFNEVASYAITQIPFVGNPAILEIEELQVQFKNVNDVLTTRNKIKIKTNSGTRTIECSSCDLLNP